MQVFASPNWAACSGGRGTSSSVWTRLVAMPASVLLASRSPPMVELRKPTDATYAPLPVIGLTCTDP